MWAFSVWCLCFPWFYVQHFLCLIEEEHRSPWWTRFDLRLQSISREAMLDPGGIVTSPGGLHVAQSDLGEIRGLTTWMLWSSCNRAHLEDFGWFWMILDVSMLRWDSQWPWIQKVLDFLTCRMFAEYCWIRCIQETSKTCNSRCNPEQVWLVARKFRVETCLIWKAVYDSKHRAAIFLHDASGLWANLLPHLLEHVTCGNWARYRMHRAWGFEAPGKVHSSGPRVLQLWYRWYFTVLCAYCCERYPLAMPFEPRLERFENPKLQFFWVWPESTELKSFVFNSNI